MDRNAGLTRQARSGRHLTWACQIAGGAVLAAVVTMIVACGARDDASLNAVRLELSRDNVDGALLALDDVERRESDLVETIRTILAMPDSGWEPQLRGVLDDLRDADATVRDLRGRALAEELDDRSIERMRALDGERNLAAEQLAAKTAAAEPSVLSSIPDDAVDVALLALECQPESTLTHAGTILEKLGSASRAPLTAALKHEEPIIRAGAVRALGRLGEAGVVAALSDLVGVEENFEVLYELPIALGRYDGLESVRALVAMLDVREDGIPSVPSGWARAEAIQQLSRLLPNYLALADEIVPTVLGRLGDENAAVVARARDVLIFLGSTAVPATLDFAGGGWRTTPLSVVALIDEDEESDQRAALFTHAIHILVELHEPTMMSADQRAELVRILDDAFTDDDLRPGIMTSLTLSDAFYAPTGVPNKGALPEAPGNVYPGEILTGSGDGGGPMHVSALPLIQKMGGYVVDMLAKHLNSDEVRIRVSAAKTLGAIRDRRVAGAIVAGITNEREPEPLAAMIGAAASIKIRAAFPILVDMLGSRRSSDPRVKMAATAAIAAIGDGYQYPEEMIQAVEGIRALMLDRNERESVRATAVGAFAILKPDGVALDLRSVLLGEQEPDTLRKAAAFAIGELGAKSVDVAPALAEILSIRRDERNDFLRRLKKLYGNEDTLNEHWEALGWEGGYRNFREVKVIPSLVRSDVVHAYRKILGAEATPLLMEVLEDDQRAAVRQAAAGALGVVLSGTDALIKAVKSDEVGAVRAAAAAALGLIKGEAGVRPLLDTLRDDEYETARRNAAVGVRSVPTDPRTFLTEAAVEELVRILLGEHLRGDELPVASVFNEIAATIINEGNSNRVMVRDAVLRTLDHPHPKIRATGLTMLGSFLAPGSVDPAIDLLEHDEDPNVREAAVFVLGQMKYTQAVPTLLGLLENRDELDRVRDKAAWALGATLAREATGALIDALHDPYPNLRVTASAALKGLVATDAIPHLSDLARDRGQPTSVRVTAIDALSGLASPVSRATILELIGRERGPVRLAAVTAVSALRPEGAHGPVLAILRNRGEQDVLRRAASVAVAAYGGSASAVALAARVTDETERKSESVNVAGRIDEHYLFWEMAILAGRGLPLPSSLMPRVEELFRDEWYPIHFRRVLPRLMGAMRDPAARPLHREMLEHSDPYVRRGAIAAVAQTGDAGFVPFLLPLLETPGSVEAQREVPLVLAALRDPQAIDPLATMLASAADVTVRTHSAIALGQLGGWEALRDAVENEATAPGVLIECLKGLGSLGARASGALEAVDAAREHPQNDISLHASAAYDAITAARNGS